MEIMEIQDKIDQLSFSIDGCLKLVESGMSHLEANADYFFRGMYLSYNEIYTNYPENYPNGKNIFYFIGNINKIISYMVAEVYWLNQYVKYLIDSI